MKRIAVDVGAVGLRVARFNGRCPGQEKANEVLYTPSIVSYKTSLHLGHTRSMTPSLCYPKLKRPPPTAALCIHWSELQ